MTRKLLFSAVLCLLVLFTAAALADIGSEHPTAKCKTCGKVCDFVTEGEYTCTNGGSIWYDCEEHGWFSVVMSSYDFHKDMGDFEFTGKRREGDMVYDAKCGEEADMIGECGYCHAYVRDTYTVPHEEKPGSRKITPATCTGPGRNEYICAKCGDTVGFNIPSQGHSPKAGSYKIVVQPTCGKKGTQTFYCDRCGETVSISVSATGEHDFGDWKTATAPTCTEKGTEKRECSVCGKFEYRYADPIGHKMSSEPFMVVPYTDWSAGIMAVGCTRPGCNYYTGPGTSVFPPHTCFFNYIGNESSTVKHVQEMLNQLSFDCGSPDGDYGTKTRSAIGRYQQDLGIPRDFICWPGLIKYLEEDTAKRSLIVTADDCGGDEYYYHKAGDVITVNVTVKNNGEAPLDSARIVSTLASHNKNPRGEWKTDYCYESKTMYSLDVVLQPGESVTIPGITYTITEDDVKNGFVRLAYIPSATYKRHNHRVYATTSGGTWVIYPCSTITTVPKNNEPTITLTQLSAKQNKYARYTKLDFMVSVTNNSNSDMTDFNLLTRAVNHVGINIFNTAPEDNVIPAGQTRSFYFTWYMTHLAQDLPTYGWKNGGDMWILKYIATYKVDEAGKNGAVNKVPMTIDKSVGTYYMYDAPLYTRDVYVEVNELTGGKYSIYNSNETLCVEVVVKNNSSENLPISRVKVIGELMTGDNRGTIYNSSSDNSMPVLRPGESCTYTVKIDVGDKTGMFRYRFFAAYTYTEEYPDIELDKTSIDYINYDLLEEMKTVTETTSTQAVSLVIRVQ